MFDRRNPRSLPPFQKGELSSGKLNSLRIAAAKRIRGLFGRDSASSATTSPVKQQALRERPIFGLNKTGQNIPAFSIFSIKKSGEIDYAWGPPIHTEANSFEHGLIYYTNRDFEIADGEGHWCEVVGDLPVLIRSTDNLQEPPKIGHPMGPLEDGTMSIERCGYVVVAEPWKPDDMGLDGHYVWVTKSNDQVIRVKLKEDIDQRARGKVCVLGVPPSNLSQAEVCDVKDPNTVAPDPGFEIRKVINLTNQKVYNDQIVHIHPVLGIGYAIIDEPLALATIVFTMLEDRTRETVGGLSVGRADVLITDKVGTAGEAVGSTVRPFFADGRWLGAVAGCQGVADYIYDPIKASALQQEQPYFWIVKECQELAAGFFFVTTEDRASGAPDQDVEVEVTGIQRTGHANADYPPEWWGGQPVQGGQPNQCSGNAWWHYVNSEWVLVENNCSPGCTPVPPPPDLPPDWLYIGGCSSTGQPSPERKLTVRYRAGMFPRMVTGAIGYAEFDNAIENTDDNTTMRYYVTVSQELVDAISGSLPNDSCKADFTVSGIQHDSPWPHNQPIPSHMLPLIISNPRHYGLTGDSWAATWSDAEQKYVCIDMEKHSVSVSSISEVTDQAGCKTIYSTARFVGVELCEPSGQAIPLISYRTQSINNPTAFRLFKDEEGSGSQVTCSEPQLVVDIDRYQVLVTCDPSTPTTLQLPLIAKTVLTSFNANGCPMWVTQKLLVFEACGDAILHEADCDPCPTDSSGS